MTEKTKNSLLVLTGVGLFIIFLIGLAMCSCAPFKATAVSDRAIAEESTPIKGPDCSQLIEDLQAQMDKASEKMELSDPAIIEAHASVKDHECIEEDTAYVTTEMFLKLRYTDPDTKQVEVGCFEMLVKGVAEYKPNKRGVKITPIQASPNEVPCPEAK